jgi:pimeloyl-ACP methyl ester carboxylesterase
MALDLAFESTGSGPPLVILDGLFGSGGNWRGIAQELAATHGVLTVDLRNHGASPWADSMGYLEMADRPLGVCRPSVALCPGHGRRRHAGRGRQLRGLPALAETVPDASVRCPF